MKDTDAFNSQESLRPQLIPRTLSKLGRFSYLLHNVVGHPLAEMFWVLGLHKIGDYIHDITVPCPDTKE